MQNSECRIVGSDASAAGGRYSELSDARRSGCASEQPAKPALSESQWQRSIKSRKSVSPKILSGTATGILLRKMI